MTKYLLVVAFLSALSINDVVARNFQKRQASDDPVIDDAAAIVQNADAGAPPPSMDGAVATDAGAPPPSMDGAVATDAGAPPPSMDGAVATDAGAPPPSMDGAVATDAGAPPPPPSMDGAVATDALVPGTEPMSDLPSDPENPAVSTGTEIAPESSPQSEAPGSPPVPLDPDNTAPGETSGPLPEQIPPELAGTSQSETVGPIQPEAPPPPEPVNTIEGESPGSPPAESPETLPPAPEEAAGAPTESVAEATAQGSEPVLQPGSELPSGVPGPDALPVAPVVPIASEIAVVDSGNPAVISKLIPEIISGLQPVPVGPVESGSANPTIPIIKTGEAGVKGAVVPISGSTGGPVPTEDGGVFPFQGGFVFDSPFFSFAQIEDYFKKLEKAMEKIFKDTMKDVNTDSDLYKNTTERVVDVDGTRYKVHTTIIRGGDENNAVSIEAVSAVPESKRRKRSLF